MENFWSFYSKQQTNTKKSVDLSSCLLVEASGDSEVDFQSDPNLPFFKFDDDDAESWSCDVSDCSCAEIRAEAYVNGGVLDFRNNVKEQNQEEKFKDEDDEVRFYQKWVDQKSCVSEESTNEPINEMERNKLFWEACLAS
ncbi:uncharacterized protein LOC126688041 [Mercurialis annua]|uniref:uncharacterized protein LOC126688041 n=1 Tax=Mercurialis annua TaxID=3986 RepID=UPI0021608999|nr:uncharacterized protein LOC126688041 [Mercurialis annua]